VNHDRSEAALSSHVRNGGRTTPRWLYVTPCRLGLWRQDLNLLYLHVALLHLPTLPALLAA